MSCNPKSPKAYTMKIYNSDTGNRDLGKEYSYPRDTAFEVIIEKAVELKAPLIVLTSFMSIKRPGKYYIKGSQSDKTWSEIRHSLEINQHNNRHSRRKAWLLEEDIHKWKYEPECWGELFCEYCGDDYTECEVCEQQYCDNCYFCDNSHL